MIARLFKLFTRCRHSGEKSWVHYDRKEQTYYQICWKCKQPVPYQGELR